MVSLKVFCHCFGLFCSLALAVKVRNCLIEAFCHRTQQSLVTLPCEGHLAFQLTARLLNLRAFEKKTLIGKTVGWHFVSPRPPRIFTHKLWNSFTFCSWIPVPPGRPPGVFQNQTQITENSDAVVYYVLFWLSPNDRKRRSNLFERSSFNEGHNSPPSQTHPEGSQRHVN